MAVLWALPIILAAMVHRQTAHGLGGSLDNGPFEPTSTLDAHVPRQNWEGQKTLIDFVDSGILLGHKPPQFRPPKLAAPLGAPLKKSLTTPSPPVKNTPSTQIVPQIPAPAKKQVTADASAKVSPFRKWVKPQTSSTDPERGSGNAAESELAARQLARRAKSLPKIEPEFEQALPLPLPTKQRMAVASDLPVGHGEKEERRAVEISTRPSTKRKQSTQPPGFLTPVPERVPQVSSANLPPLTKSQLDLRDKIRRVLTHYYNRPLNTRDRSPWELMHAMLAFEAHSRVLQGGPKGQSITAVGWLCFNQACKRRTLMYVDDDEELSVRVGPALQGHRGQLLAMLAQSRINENYPMLVEGHELKVADLIDMEKRTCYPRTELTFKLIGLMHYLDSDEKWLNDQGLEWSIPKLISEELRQPVRGAACGGTHRLSGLTLAYKTRERRGQPVAAEYLRAKKFVSRYQQYAYRLQNRDGSFSTEWFRGPGNEEDLGRRLKTTGHTLEWLLYAASEKDLRHWRTTKAANYLANIMYRNRYKDWEAGPLGHAVHALLVYDRLIFSPYESAQRSPIASQAAPSKQTRRKR